MTGRRLNHRRVFVLWAVGAVALGWITYLPAWKTHFYWDDVDYFGALCESVQDGTYWQWFGRPFPVHWHIPTKLSYYAFWKWLGRDVFYAHLLWMTVWSVAVVALADMLRLIFRRPGLALAMTAIFATSPGYRALIVEPPTAAHLWSGCFTVAAMWAAVRYLRRGRWATLAATIVSALAAYASTGLGALAFPLVGAIWLVRPQWPRARSIILAGACAAGFVGVILIQRALAEHAGPPADLRFAARETLRGCLELASHYVPSHKLSYLASVGAVAMLAMRWRESWRMFLYGAMLIVVPLVFATAFRSDVPGIGAANRYAFLPTLGMTLWLGEGLRIHLPARIRWPVGRRGRAAIVSLILAVNAVYGIRKQEMWRVKDTEQLWAIEREIGAATAQFARRLGMSTVPLPRWSLDLPMAPPGRDLPLVARYCVPADAGLRIIVTESDKTFETFLGEYDPILLHRLRDQPTVTK